MMKNITQVDFNEENLHNVHFSKDKSMPVIENTKTPRSDIYVENAISNSVDESSLLRLDPDEKLKLDEHYSRNINSSSTSPKTKIECSTKLYVGSLHENSRSRRNLSAVLNDRYNEGDYIKFTNLNSNTFRRDPSTDEKLANKNYVDGSLGGVKILKFNQSEDNYLKISVGNDTYNLSKYDKKQVTDTTIVKTLTLVVIY